MWDNKAPLRLLQSMPKKLSKENLEKIQMVIDADKYKNSLISGFDLCGMYAPFCRDCKKTSIYPCAVAYINMLKADGMDVDIDAKPLTLPQDESVHIPAVQETAVADETEDKEEVSENKVEEAEEQAPAEESSTVHSKVKHRIRIAVARKKL